jgi:PEP-CTERM motif
MGVRRELVAPFLAHAIASHEPGENPKYVYFSSDYAQYQAIPEPSSVTLLTMGFATIGVVGWVRRRRTVVA